MSIVSKQLFRMMQWVFISGFLLQQIVAQSGTLPGGDVDFFEKQIRPLLADRCYKCHSEQSEKLKGALKVDSREGLLRGGETRTALVPGHPEKSLLIEAVNYTNPDLQMPPKDRLSTEEIALLTLWVKHGAPWPKSSRASSNPAGSATTTGIDIDQRKRDHWAWQPVVQSKLPRVNNPAWGFNPVDQFILAGLEKNHVKPAPDADKLVLIRRLYFDLVGLPPTPEEVAHFINDDSPTAYLQLVDRLLGSHRFGELWGRHWLDLVRYSETLGHEFDFEIPNAYRYRDYVVRALNADVPYDQFLREHLAGDLLDNPRINPDSGENESLIGPGFYWLGQQTHSPVDVKAHQSEFIDNQIDVLSKTFLGLTVACARCHDHKFDPIPTRDYYSLYGVLSSSRYSQRSLLTPEKNRTTLQHIATGKGNIRHGLIDLWLPQSKEITNYIAALQSPTNASLRAGLNTNKLNALKQSLDDWAKLPSINKATPTMLWVDASNPSSLNDWTVEGDAFRDAMVSVNETLILDNDHHPRLVVEPMVHSGRLSGRLQGAIRSPTMTITNRFLHLRVAGRESRFNIIVDNFLIIQDPIYGSLRRVMDREELNWITIDLERWKGHRTYVEFSDYPTRDLGSGGKGTYGETGWIAFTHIVKSDLSTPPEIGVPTFKNKPELPLISQLENELSLIKRQSNQPAMLLSLLVRHGFFDHSKLDVGAMKILENKLSHNPRAPSMADGTGLDESIFVRGNHRLEGENAPRRFLEAVDGKSRPSFKLGSGRRELAERMLHSENPFPARVAVNRVWHHLFGRGIVASTDDFGKLGQEPTHPELLNWLASNYRSDLGWSTKKLIRLLVTTRTYRMSSKVLDQSAEQADPSNLMWHRMPIKRLEGEVIRDTILALSGRLDESMYGVSVPVHLTEFMEGRGRPGHSGPIDGARRRSIYQEVRRNFLSPLMRTFDMPVPYSTVGRRTVSNVPAQSLILLNDPFIKDESMNWAKRVMKSKDDGALGIIRRVYQQAFGREPTLEELQQSNEFLTEQAKLHGTIGIDESTVADLCHVLINVKSFIYIN